MKENATYYTKDFKASVLIAEILHHDKALDLDHLILSPDGGFNHQLRRELDGIVKIDYDIGYDTIYKAKIGKKGLLDNLPDNLIFSKRKNPIGLNKKERSIKDIKDREEAEKAGRKFFAPFDHYFQKYLLDVEIEERKFILNFPDYESHSFYDILWSHDHSFLNQRQKNNLFYLLPLAPLIIDNPDFLQYSFGAVLGLDVTIEQGNKTIKVPPYDHECQLGNITLSNNALLGDQMIQTFPSYRIIIRDITFDSITDFLPEGKAISTLDLLEAYFVPTDIISDYRFCFHTEQLQLSSSDYEEHDASNRLGYTIHI